MHYCEILQMFQIQLIGGAAFKLEIRINTPPSSLP